ncbi:MAG: ABC transporter ATP-binding protein [Phycisphaerales bacterium]|nr:ABC transporter ATP-binding protein [Phycisphaerales bacterium]
MIELEGVSRTFRTRGRTIEALADVDLTIDQGAFLVVRGQSGSGKTTFLLTIGAMQAPTAGHVRFDGEDLYTRSASWRASFRARHIGFVFQSFHLLPYLSVLDNVLLSSSHGRREALDMLERLGIGDRALQKPTRLSVGERQRAAVARALLIEPEAILADEPTGNLDDEHAGVIVDALEQANAEGRTVLLVTHRPHRIGRPVRTLHLERGRVREAEVTHA